MKTGLNIQVNQGWMRCHLLVLNTFICLSCSNATESVSSQNYVQGRKEVVQIQSVDGNLILVSTATGVLVQNLNVKNNQLGLVEGDVLHALDEQKISTPEEFMEILRSSKLNEIHSVDLSRNGKLYKVSIDPRHWKNLKTPKPPEVPHLTHHVEAPKPPTND